MPAGCRRSFDLESFSRQKNNCESGFFERYRTKPRKGILLLLSDRFVPKGAGPSTVARIIFSRQHWPRLIFEVELSVEKEGLVNFFDIGRCLPRSK